MTTLEIIQFVIDALVVIIGGGWLIKLFTVKSHVKQEQAEAEKTVEEAKEKQIENIKNIFIDLYQPVIDDLQNRLTKMGTKIEEVEKENSDLKKEMADLKKENSRLRKENEELRDALREIRPDIMPSKRSINAQNQARGNHGQFVKKIEGNYDKSEK